MNADDSRISYLSDYRGDCIFISESITEGQIANIIKQGQEWLDNLGQLAGDR